MMSVGSVPGLGDGGLSAQTTSVTAAAALALLRRHPSSTVTISDTTQNILKNLDALQKVGSKITSLATSDVTKNMVVTGTQYQHDAAVLALWGATSGQTLGVTGMKAASAVSALPGYVTSVTVADSSANIQNNLDQLQSLTASGVLREIVQTGTPANLTLTTAQLTTDQAALGAIKNHAYTLAISNASVSDVLGLGSAPALSANAKIKALSIVDTTDAIRDNLDALQRVGLRIKSIAQTDAATPLTVTGRQYDHDQAVLGKFITADHLVVIEASASRLRSLHADHKVVTVSVNDTAANLSRNWAVLQSLTDSLTSVEVSNQASAISLTADQLADSTTLLGKFTDTSGQSYKLAITKANASDALAIANNIKVSSIDIADTGDNVASSMDDLHTVDSLGKLNSITLGTTRATMSISLDVSRLRADQVDDTQSVLDKIKHGAYTLTATGASASDLSDLATNRRVSAIMVSDSSANIKSAIDTLYHLGGRLTDVQQTDSGTALELTQKEFDSRSSVLNKIAGGYTANLSGVTAGKAATDAANVHVAGVAVSDSGRNLMAHWAALRSLGATLDSVTKSDDGALTLTAANYELGVQDDLISKFGQDTTFSVNAASVDQAQAIMNDQAVTQIDVADQGSVIAGNLSALADLLATGKLTSIINVTPAESLSLDAIQLSAGQDVLDLIRGGSYTLALSGVDVADAGDLLASNHKIVSMAVTGDSSSIVSSLSDLTTAGRKITSITQTDAPGTALEMTGAAFEQNVSTLAKIEGGFVAILNQVSAAKAVSYTDNASIVGLTVSDTGAHLSSAWESLDGIGSKLTEVTQDDSSNLQLSFDDWTDGQDLRGKFTSDPTVSISGVDVSQVADLADDSAVQAIQVSDSASTISAALADLAGQSKITQLVLEDPTVALTMSGQAYHDSAALLGLVKNHDYAVELGQVTAQDAATLASDAHVSSMDVTDTASEISSHFTALAAATNLNSITLDDQDGTITLTSDQILDNAGTLDLITNSYQLAATGVAIDDLTNIQDVPQVSSISISDTSDNVSTNFGDLVALGGTLGQLHLSDGSPVLSLSETAWAAGSDVLAKIDGSYQVDVTDTLASDAQTTASNGSVRHVLVADTASNISGQWDALVGLYNAGAGKLTGVSLTDSDPLTLTSDQQTAGAAMIADLMPDATILTAA